MIDRVDIGNRAHSQAITFKVTMFAVIAYTLVALGVTVRAAEPAKLHQFPSELVDFVPYEKNPVFTAAGPGKWDAKIRERGWVMRDGDKYLMWYTGYNGMKVGFKMLGLATSDDGLSWTRYSKNPVYDQNWTEDMMVIKQGPKLYMFAEGFRHGRAYPFAGRLQDEPHLLTSSNGINWTRQGALAFRNAVGDPSGGIYGTPAAWFEDGHWYLFYEKMDLGVWLARSRDLLVWTNVQDDPVIMPGPDAYDNRMIALNQIIKYQGRYYGYYHAMGDSEPGKWSTCVAVSDDMRQWHKYHRNPIVKNNKSSGILVPDGNRYRLYTMHDQVDVYFPRKK
ncbi:MAG TPA: hypothetical protein VGG64_16715 [Pirellulales bacterium]|jgi:predicted GH43/DUF377 family glycosyl hydrolase